MYCINNFKCTLQYLVEPEIKVRTSPRSTDRFFVCLAGYFFYPVHQKVGWQAHVPGYVIIDSRYVSCTCCESTMMT